MRIAYFLNNSRTKNLYGRLSVNNTRINFLIGKVSPEDWNDKLEVSNSNLKLNKQLMQLKEVLKKKYYESLSKGKLITAKDLKEEAEKLLIKNLSESIISRSHELDKKSNQDREKYYQAFMQFFKCERKDFEAQDAWMDGPMLARYMNNVYRVDNISDIRQGVNDLLTDEESAMKMPLGAWLEVVEDVHVKTKFLKSFLSKLRTVNDFNIVNTVINASKIALDPSGVFWETLYQLDQFNLFPKAILSASETANFEDTLMELLLSNGKEEYCELVGGIFKTVVLDNEKEDNDENVFYIYSADPGQWE